jgi:hypothetical protein
MSTGMKIVFGVLLGLGIYHVSVADEVAEAVAAPPRRSCGAGVRNTPPQAASTPQYDVMHCSHEGPCAELDGLRGAFGSHRYNDLLTFSARGRRYVLQSSCGCYVEDVP